MSADLLREAAALMRKRADSRPMSAKRRAAIAAADLEDARRGVPDPTRDVDTDSGTCVHGLPGCRCDGNPHSIVGRAS